MKKKRVENPSTCKKKNHCKICNKYIIGSAYKFRAHLHLHKAVQPRFICSFCSMEYYRRDLFVRHVNSHTGFKTKKNYICDHCERGFSEKRNLILHLKLHDDQSYVQYKCMACNKSYCEERLLKYHIRKHHFNLNEKEDTYPNKQLNETWLEQVNSSEVCVQMTKVNNNVITIQRIDMIKTENKPKTSPLLPNNIVMIPKDLKEEKTDLTRKEKDIANNKQKFKQYMSSVLAHKDKSQYSTATCDYCKKEMLKKSLISHIRERHMNIYKFKCEECNSNFKRHYQMVDHDCEKYKKKKRKQYSKRI